MEALKRFAQTHRQESPGQLFSKEVGVRINTSGQEVKRIKPNGISDGEIIADPANVAGSKDAAALSLSVILANPPPQVFGLNELQRPAKPGAGDLFRVNPIPVTL
jgi:hypothetical protein